VSAGQSDLSHGLRDDEFARIEKQLPGRPGHVGRNSDLGNQLFVETVIWKFRTGVPWRGMPPRFGAWKNIHTRFSRWAIKGVWESLFKSLADDPDNEYAMIDATIVRAHQHSAGARKKKGVNQAIGRSRGGLTTKKPSKPPPPTNCSRRPAIALAPRKSPNFSAASTAP
jgi:transposase